MSARFDREVMDHLVKLHRQYLLDQSSRPTGVAAARLSLGESMAFASPGQNPEAAFQENISALASENQEQDFVSLYQSLSDGLAEEFASEKILQPRRLSLRVF